MVNAPEAHDRTLWYGAADITAIFQKRARTEPRIGAFPSAWRQLTFSRH